MLSFLPCLLIQRPPLPRTAVVSHSRTLVRACAPDGPPHDSLLQRRADGSVILPDGFLVVDKPMDWTSFDVVGKVRNTLERFYKDAGHKFGRKSRLKVGHGGTLDPLATGVLVVGVGSGTKRMADYLKGPKNYIARAQLGCEMDTQDSTGTELLSTAFDHVTLEDLERAAAPLRGEIMQRPPIYSALKRDGVRMYELARAGKITEEDMEPRPVTVHKLTIEEFDQASGQFCLNVCCSGGTYIRSLIVELARGSESSAHMTALQRTTHGPFGFGLSDEVEIVSADDLADAPRLLAAIASANKFVEANQGAEADNSSA